ncbi:hypothetical protein L1787_22395 [Acuticoccus sp. M5D2P5]|uniref:hypothetical protein n=1 Tax=Acuticoccus kalidii TaxID=2910977 RepID=UPI001F33A06F|nr:hypothetical protein [Acuticoccus kalidii]MCF3936145.1 hypothetical protein [Acuticoccus kalidii]
MSDITNAGPARQALVRLARYDAPSEARAEEIFTEVKTMVEVKEATALTARFIDEPLDFYWIQREARRARGKGA